MINVVVVVVVVAHLDVDAGVIMLYIVPVTVVVTIFIIIVMVSIMFAPVTVLIAVMLITFAGISFIGVSIITDYYHTGESRMARISIPLIAGQGGGEYELIARIYDVLDDFTEVSSTIMVILIILSDRL